ncbi:MAG: thioredoxin-dependent thiol peroxidase [Micavibrio sp.]|nr:thioredoxin-dependent thiol peroxidase [Micavibrio sp.]|tara:strand:- start:1238 stop:1702 length:465 start_codon:yes stop_codon:yes gene_type:complete
MTVLKEGDIAPDFTLPADGGKTISLKDYKGKKLVLYFYPKDDTSGCTKEACAFEANLAKFSASGATILGVSKDSVKRHEKFKEKYNLTLPLLSDENSDMCERYGVWKKKSMYGREYMGIERTTFLIDEKGKIGKIWHKVKVDGHVDDVLSSVAA